MTRFYLSGGHRVRQIVSWTLLAGIALVLLPASLASADPGPQDQIGAQQQAALVQNEDKRLNQIRAVAAIANLQWQFQAQMNAIKNGTWSSRKIRGRLSTSPWQEPFRVNTGGGYTLVLTAQANPYTVADLLRLAPQTFVRQPDGAYLLSENIYLSNGATLNLSAPNGLVIRLASSARGFVSIVSFGGILTIAGTVKAPVTITSWDPQMGRPDSDVTDGRAYIRTIGGKLSVSYAALSDLGFWSGRTGGLSITGNERPSIGAIRNGAPQGNQNAGGSVTIAPGGPLSDPTDQFQVPDPTYVTAAISHTSITRNVFGFFASGAHGVSVTDTTVQQSRADGIVMHRLVDNADIERVTSRSNAVDGFVVSRATQQVRLNNDVAEGNGRNGFTFNGEALAAGPSASGESTAMYGSNSVSHSVARSNVRYGIEVIGGVNVVVSDNQVVDDDMGIVVRQAADAPSITGNTVSQAVRQGISVRDGVSRAMVTGNVVRGVQNSIYIRDSSATVRGNTVKGGSNHGISLVGTVSGSVVASNVVGGMGPSAIDTLRARGDVTLAHNRIGGWFDTRAFWARISHFASPMTLLWTAIVLLILLSAAKGARRRTRHRIVHPYADKKPLPMGTVREVTAGVALGRTIRSEIAPAYRLNGSEDPQTVSVMAR